MRREAVVDELARAMARSADSIRGAVRASFHAGVPWPERSELRRALRDAPFADAIAQTLVMAMFTARVLHEDGELFTVESASATLARCGEIPSELDAVLRTARAAQEPFAGAATHLCDVLSHAHAAGAFAPFGRDGAAGEALLTVYEMFLAAYDPALRRLRGVYFTPQPIAGYVVRAIAQILEDAFGIAPDAPGAALEVLDPACGTGMFLHEYLSFVRERFAARGDGDGWRGFVEGVLPGRLAGFEMLLAPYAVAHLNVMLALRGASPESPVRLSLGNALDAPRPRDGARVRGGVLVVMGNPPYSGHAANPSVVYGRNGAARRTPVGRLLQDYAANVDEANTKWLHDDYVKFIRFAEDRVEHAGRGIVAFVTSHAYLDNPTFAGMRRHLMRTFDEIFVLDLHGNAKIGETGPGGVRDQNVFDIRQGVAIGIFVKRGPERTGDCAVKFAELYGDRKTKLGALSTADLRSTEWTAVAPSAAATSFRPARGNAPLGYARAPSLRSAMPVSSLGVLTKRDALAVACTPGELLERLAWFADSARSDDETAAAFGLPLRDKDRWSLADARRIAAHADPAQVRTIQYRCGDVRVYYDAGGIVARRNRRVLDHVGGAERPAFLVGRQGGAATSGTWDSVWATAESTDQNVFRRGGATVFPIRLNGEHGRGDGPRWNFSREFVDYVRSQTADRGGDDSLHERAAGYIYGLLSAPRFHTEFAEELKRDFPRIPIASAESFAALSDLGWRLLRLHLLADVVPSVSFPVAGDDIVDARTFALTSTDAAGYGNVVVNAAGQRFEGVHRHAWQRTCGGSPVLERYLKARRGRRLDAGEIRAFAVLATALERERPLLAAADDVLGALLLDADIPVVKRSR